MKLETVLKAVKQATTDPTFPGLPIYVNPIGLDEARATLQSDVYVSIAKGASLSEVLRETLRTRHLSFIVRDGFVMISSRQEVADQRLEDLEKKVNQLLDAMDQLEGKLTAPSSSRLRSGSGIR